MAGLASALATVNHVTAREENHAHHGDSARTTCPPGFQLGILFPKLLESGFCFRGCGTYHTGRTETHSRFYEHDSAHTRTQTHIQVYIDSHSYTHTEARMYASYRRFGVLLTRQLSF